MDCYRKHVFLRHAEIAWTEMEKQAKQRKPRQGFFVKPKCSKKSRQIIEQMAAKYAECLKRLAEK